MTKIALAVCALVLSSCAYGPPPDRHTALGDRMIADMEAQRLGDIRSVELGRRNAEQEAARIKWDRDHHLEPANNVFPGMLPKNGRAVYQGGGVWAVWGG